MGFIMGGQWRGEERRHVTMVAKFLDHNMIWSLSNDDGDGNENGKKEIRLYQQNNNFERTSCFFVHFLAVVARLRHETS